MIKLQLHDGRQQSYSSHNHSASHVSGLGGGPGHPAAPWNVRLMQPPVMVSKGHQQQQQVPVTGRQQQQGLPNGHQQQGSASGLLPGSLTRGQQAPLHNNSSSSQQGSHVINKKHFSKQR